MNKTVYQDTSKNAVRFSEFLKFECETPFGGLGIKYVCSGEEIYYVNGKKFSLKAGEYLIGNEQSLASVKIKSMHTVQGICIDLSSELISAIAKTHQQAGRDLEEFLLTDRLLINRYQGKHSEVSGIMSMIHAQYEQGKLQQFIQEDQVLLSLAEALITEQKEVNVRLQKLRFKRPGTDREILRSLLRAKSYMDEKISDNICLDEVSLFAGISKFHFIRLFKTTFGISPYQYMKANKLDRAGALLQTDRSIAEVAFLLGYPDVQSFSKAFKQYHGLAPAQWQKSNF